MTLETTLNEVLRKIGRNVILFQELEHLLKYLVADGPISGYISELEQKMERRKSSTNTQTMGQLIGQYFENSSPENQEILEDPKYFKEERFIWFKYGSGDPSFHDKKKKTLAKLVADRNELIHHLLPQLDTNSIESCIEVGKKLDEQRDKIVRQSKNLRLEIDAIQQSAKLMVSFFNSSMGRAELERLAELSK